MIFSTQLPKSFLTLTKYAPLAKQLRSIVELLSNEF